MLGSNPLWRSLVGVPYACPCDPPQSFDCFRLVVWVRERCYGMRTPLVVPLEYICEDNMATLLQLHRERDIYPRVDKPIPSDIIIFENNHVGVAVEGGVLSAVSKGAHQVIYFDWQKMRRFFSSAYPVRLNEQ